MKNLLKFVSIIFVFSLVFTACGGNNDGDEPGENELLLTSGLLTDEDLANDTTGWTSTMAGSDYISEWDKSSDGYVVFSPNYYINDEYRIQAHYLPVRDSKWSGKLTGGVLPLPVSVRDGFFECEIKMNKPNQWSAAYEKSLGIYEAATANTEDGYTFTKYNITGTPAANTWFKIRLPLQGNVNYGSNAGGINKAGLFSFYILGLPDDTFELTMRNLKFTAAD